MIRKLIFVTLVLFTLSSCSILFPTLDKKVGNLELGMSKKEVLNVVGKSYELVGASMTPEGTAETILLKDKKSSNYVLSFLENKLVSIKRDRFGNATFDAVPTGQPTE